MRKLGRENPYYGYSTPMIKGRLFDLVREMDVRPIHKSLTLGELVARVMTELPVVAPEDPRTQIATDLAGVLWERSRD
ncbi:MAG: hypothetical protein ACTHN0_18640 [Aquihabitans sp.]